MCTDPRATRSIALGGMRLTEHQIPPGSWVGPHEERCCVVVLVLDGDFRERTASGDHEVGAGVLYARPAGVRHSRLVGADGARCLVIELLDRPDAEPCDDAGSGRPRVLADPRCERIGRRIVAMTWDAEPARRLRIEALVLELLACAASPVRGRPTAPPEWLAQAHEQVIASFRDPPSIASLAARAGVHPGHLLRSFRRHYGVSPTELARRHKAEHALLLLDDPTTSLSAVAFEAGFADQSHMGRVLRRLYGTTPGQLRRERRHA